MNRHHLFSVCVMLLAAAFPCAYAQAQPGWGHRHHHDQPNLVVFGDSLSDTGNTFTLTGGLWDPQGAIPPEPFYDHGRFSNGPVWVEYLAHDLDLPTPRPAFLGGTNFAYGGAQTQDTPGVTPGVPFIDMDEQVDLYKFKQLFTRHNPRNDLFVVWGGANDLLLGEPTGVANPPRAPRNPVVAAANIKQHISDLYDAGGREFLVPNLPPVGDIPAVTDPTARAGLNALAGIFNQALAADLDALEAQHADIDIYRMDVAGFTQQVLADPQAYGFSNVTDAAVPGLSVVTGTFPDPNSDWQPDDPDSYLFWDDTHLTTAFQKLLGGLALQALAAGNSPFAHDEYLAQTLSPVPEPTTLALLAVGGVPLLIRRRRHG